LNVLDRVAVVLDSSLSFAAEHFDDVITEAEPLLDEHWREIAVHKDVPLKPSYLFYHKMDKIGALKIFTVRHGGKLIGYAVFVVRPRHGHYDFAWAINDIVWVKPEFRHHGVGSALVAFWDAELARLGVQFVSVNSKVAHPALHGLLEKCGYATIEIGHQKRLS
jgi:GNAT superfamily N-acetyltransferase